MSETVEQLQAELAAAGRRPEAVMRADAATTGVPDGVYRVSRHDEGVQVMVFERGQQVFLEDFADEASAVRFLGETLLRPPAGRPRTAEETAASVARMQAKARATLDRIADERGGV